jgi:hypothetical protein
VVCRSAATLDILEMKKIETCYMCNREASSREHVPPKCFFPDRKDLPVGIDFRRNLITVPSCDLHNSGKSADDEFLLFIVTAQYRGSHLKDKHFESKVMRAFNRSPDRFINMLEGLAPHSCREPDGEVFESAVFKVDLARFDRVVRQLACGIYYHHYNKKWMGKSHSISNIFGTSGSLLSLENALIASQMDKMSRSFEGLPVHGENQQIFRYQLYTRNDSVHALHLEFFEGAKIFIALEQDA